MALAVDRELGVPPVTDEFDRPSRFGGHPRRPVGIRPTISGHSPPNSSYHDLFGKRPEKKAACQDKGENSFGSRSAAIAGQGQLTRLRSALPEHSEPLLLLPLPSKIKIAILHRFG
jgi:hypothetical protein